MNKLIRLSIVLIILAIQACTPSAPETSAPATEAQSGGKPDSGSTDPISGDSSEDPSPPTGSTIILHNNAGETIYFAYVSPCSASTWGEDQLGSSTVPDGGTFTFSVTDDCYDLMAEDSNGNEIETEWSVDVSGTYDWYVTSSNNGGQPQTGGNASIVLHNNSGQTVYFAYVSPCSASTWGEDQLGSSTVPNGGTFTFSVTDDCYDLMAEDSNGNEIETEWGVDVSGTYDWYIASSSNGGQPQTGGNASIVLHNNSGQTVYYAYVSDCSESTWGQDDLGSSTVPNGGTFTFSVDAGCYDLLAEDSNGNEIETEWGANVSGTYDWYVTGSGGGQPAPGTDSIVLHNNSGQTIWYAYVSPCSDSTWGDDDLGSSTVPSGGTFTFSVQAGCYDLKVEDSNHNEIDIEWAVNVSGTYNWYVP